ncbi:Proteasome subunit beta type-1 [Zea mays]|uniref:Proteasome subunit beta type-1 n=1 Tax=Zea mays TaxID=4577 RepID=A0A1D6HP47_MAIZE|nr:Proteasome subunit beta type-1 [Zea mays]ONM37404.1 Proteasome subunit beta type-1 [Zea mays]
MRKQEQEGEKVQGDIKALHKNLAVRELLYQHQHNKRMSCPAMAQLLSNTLYYKCFFPYYAFNVLGGLDSEEAIDLVKDVFASEPERDIYTSKYMLFVLPGAVRGYENN